MSIVLRNGILWDVPNDIEDVEQYLDVLEADYEKEYDNIMKAYFRKHEGTIGSVLGIVLSFVIGFLCCLK
jgi:tetrahydromethanopterin S-methyltransferase subunit G